jgi:hypothetical protein
MSSTLTSSISDKDLKMSIPNISPLSRTTSSRSAEKKQDFAIDEKGNLSDIDTSSRPSLDAPPKIPWKYMILALICIVSFPIGTNWTSASLGPLKNTLRNELGITNTQFGIIASSDSVVNSVWPIVEG